MRTKNHVVDFYHFLFTFGRGFPGLRRHRWRKSRKANAGNRRQRKEKNLIIGMPEQELERMETLLNALNNAFGALQICHNDAMRLLRKIHNRANKNDPLQEGYQTRLDPDIQDELDLILAIPPDEETPRPD